MVNIVDVNEAPVCPGDLRFTVDATAISGFKVGNISCFDVDRTDAFKTFSYSIDTTPDSIGKFFFYFGKVFFNVKLSVSLSKYLSWLNLK